MFKTLGRLFLTLMLAVVAVPLVILAQGSDPYPPAQPYYGELIDYPGTGNTDNSGKLLTELTEDDLIVPIVPNTGHPPTLEIVPAQSPTPELYDYPTEIVPTFGPEDIPLPEVSTVTPQPPVQPIKLMRGFYKQVGEPQITTTGNCFDPAVGLGGSCGRDQQVGTIETQDFHNCFSNDPNSPNSKPNDGLEPVCQSTDSESLYVGEPSQFYGRLVGSAYGIGSTNRQMLQQGGVSISSYGVVDGTQVEVLSPTKFVVKYVHREQGGCSYTVSVYYELSGASEAACQQVIEVTEAQQENPISTPPPLPPIEDDAPYTVALPVIPAECTADNRPPEAFKDTKVKLNEADGTLSINYGTGSYTAFQNFGSTFSYVDQRTNIFRLSFTVFSDKISFNWFKTDASGTACNLDGELRPGTSDSIENDNEASAVKNSPYKAEWKPIEAFCTPETIAKLPNFSQATITGSQDTFTIDYGTGTFPLTKPMGSDTYYYQSVEADGSMVMVSLNSHTPDKFALLYQYSDAAGNMCMANLDLTS